MSDVGDLHLATVVINTSDLRRGVDFWCAALGYEPRESTWGPEFMTNARERSDLQPLRRAAS
jgi:catechol 2,3-dioxygenase-like lactoylglutathione lyase family enzyme